MCTITILAVGTAHSPSTSNYCFWWPSYFYANMIFLGAVAVSRAAFGQGTGAIVMDSVQCRGNETSLTSCPHSLPSSSDTHSEDAGVRCRPGNRAV